MYEHLILRLTFGRECSYDYGSSVPSGDVSVSQRLRYGWRMVKICFTLFFLPPTMKDKNGQSMYLQLTLKFLVRFALVIR